MKENTRVCGHYPPELIRCFDEEQYALDFIKKGKFRVKKTTSYTKIECANRRDVDEGSGTYKRYGKRTSALFHLDPSVPTEFESGFGEVTHHTSSMNAVYLLCCTVSTDLDMVKKKFGPYPVRIDNPQKLAAMIDEYLSSGKEKFSVCGYLVQYNRGELLHDPVPEKHELAKLAYIQKAHSFSNEQEFRYCLMGSFADDAEEAMHLDLGQPLEFAKSLW